MTEERLKSLVKLLDDGDEDISCPAMAELLKGDDPKELSEVLAELQESASDNVRRKSHQMQVIQRIRGRRKRFSDRLNEDHPNLLQGLAEIHSIWYDDLDSRAVAEIWMDTLKKAAAYKPLTPKRLGKCMRGLGFKTYGDNIQDPDIYCLGAVADERMGSDILLASIALEIGRGFGLRGAVARVGESFGVLHVSMISQTSDGKPNILRGTIISAENDWTPTPVDDPSSTKIWSTKNVLKHVAALLFVNAVCSEDPRYVQILASCLTGGKEYESLDATLPYPFGSAPLQSPES